ncbi:MAG: TonB-dependent receptor plug domain-containing protein [Pseudomonadota bacterium]
MRFLRAVVFGLWGLGIWFTPMAWAEPEKDCPDCPPKAEAPIDLGDMFVTAFHGGAVTITPTKTVIDIEKFNKSGSVDRVEDILMHLTGIDVLRSSSGADPQQLILMRGFDDSRFTIAVDGRTITAPTAGSDTYVDWSSLTTGDIEKIEVIRGAASAQYENSQGGIINIITKKGKTRDSLVPKVTLSSDYSKYNSISERISLDGGVADLSYFLNYGYKESDGYLRNNDYSGNDYSARVTYLFPFKGELTLSAKGSDLDMGFAVVNDPNSSYGHYDPDYPIVPEDSDTVRRYRSASFDGGKNYKKKRSMHLDMIYDQPVPTGKLKFQLFQTTGDEDSYYYTLVANTSYRPGVDPPSKKYKLTQSFSGSIDREELHFGGRLQHQFNEWKNHSLLIGYDQRRMETGSTDDVWRMHAGYFEDTWNISSKFSLFTGLRYAFVREFTYAYADPGTTLKYRHLLHTEVLLPKSTLTFRITPDTEVFVSANKDYHVPGC